MKSETRFINWLQHVSTLLPRLGLIMILIVVVALLIGLVLRLLSMRHLLKQKVTYLELTPPAFSDKTPQATQELFSVIHRLGSKRTWKDKLLKRYAVFGLEIMSTRELGIRYVVRIVDKQAATFEQTIHGYLPEVKVKKIENYLTGKLDKKQAAVVTFRQKEHFAYPLKSHDGLEEYDPMSYLTSAMTKLASNELVIFQILLSPVKVPEAYTMRRKILRNEDLSNHLTKQKLPVGSTILHGVHTVLFGVLDTISEIHHGPSSSNSYSMAQLDNYQKHQVAQNVKPARILTAFEQTHLDSIHNKLSQSLFRTDIRALVVASSKEEINHRLHGIESAMESFSVAGYQSLDSKKARVPWLKRYHQYVYLNRLPSLRTKQSNLLSVSEISSLYHFPHSLTAKTENVVKSLSKTLPAHLSLKDGSKLDILLGANHHHGSATAIGLTAEERQRHVYIIGGTGNGKTTMLLYAITQDIKNGKGVAVLDPHGDLAETILQHIPEDRVKDVIYLNPDDLTYPIGVNLLELPEGLTGDDLLREKDLVTESTISVMRKMFSDDDSGGHRIEYVLRNTIQTALTLEGSTLFTIFRLLNDTKYRKDVVRNLEDNDLKIFWQNELAKAGDFQRVKMAAGITAKIGRFLFSASAKRVLEQEKSTIDFDDILNSGKILICNFSKGLLGEDTSTLFGTTILAKLQVASLRRARQQQKERTPYYLYVDEFQNFATMSFVQMLSEARKYKLFLTMAEQSTSQQDQQRLVDIILANVGTVICFRSASPADERYVLPLFSPYIEQGEIANLPAYNYYMRIAAVEAHEPLSGVTVLLEKMGSENVAYRVKQSSRELYARKSEPERVKKEHTTQKPKQVSTIQQKTKELVSKRSTAPRADAAALLDS